MKGVQWLKNSILNGTKIMKLYSRKLPDLIESQRQSHSTDLCGRLKKLMKWWERRRGEISSFEKLLKDNFKNDAAKSS